MRIYRSNYMRIAMTVYFIGLLSIGFAGCTNVQHQVKLNKEYLPNEDVSIKVAKVVNDTGFDFDIDIEEMLADALEDQLLEEDLLWLGGKEPALFMESRITGYKKGSAFKRWMMPGWGATELSIRCVLKDDKNNRVGSAIASREVVAGGGYTIGAWKTVFKAVANDVAEDLRAQIESLGYVVRQKTTPEKATETPIATFSPAKVDPTAPWTGVWDVQGNTYCSGRWRMIQTGRNVRSTKNSVHEIKGKAKGNQLKGRILSPTSTGQSNSFVINISSDGLSFEGTCDLPWRKNLPMKGNRKAESTVASFSPGQIDPTAPWTGVWEVVGNRQWVGKWALRQSDNKVVSTKESYYEIEGKVEENSLKGKKLAPKANYRFELKISPDYLTFEGDASDWMGRSLYFIKGRRIE